MLFHDFLVKFQSSLVDDDSDDDDGLVIDEGTEEKATRKSLEANNSEGPIVKVEEEEKPKAAPKRGRGRPKRAAKVKEEIKSEDIEEVKEEMKEEEEEEEEVPLKTTRSAANKQKQNQRMKSKTWFPGERDTRANKSGKKPSFFQTLSSPRSDNASPVPVVKKEPSEVDQKVFFGTQDIILDKNAYSSVKPAAGNEYKTDTRYDASLSTSAPSRKAWLEFKTLSASK